MKYQVGDKILVLYSNEEGEVLDIISDTMVLVEVRGVKFPIYTDQIDFPYFKRFTEKKPEVKKSRQYVDSIKRETKNTPYKVGEGVWLVFFPVFDKDVFDDDIIEKFRLYLVNQTGYAFQFSYEMSFNGISDFSIKSEVGQHSDFYLNDLAFENLNDVPKFWFEFSLTTPDKKKAPHYETFFKPRAKQVFKNVEEMHLKQEAFFSVLLFEEYPDSVDENKPDLSKLVQAGFKVQDSSKNNIRTVIDLHIEKLTDRWEKMSNGEKLELQLKTFEKYYDLALQHHQHMMIIVHGVGTGKLRNEIHEILRHKKEVKSFVNQFHPSFGYGATEIYFNH